MYISVRASYIAYMLFRVKLLIYRKQDAYTQARCMERTYKVNRLKKLDVVVIGK